MKTLHLIAPLLLCPLLAHATPAEDALRNQWWGKFNASASALPFSFTLGGKPSTEVLKTWRLERSERKLDNNRNELTLTCTDPQSGLRVRCVAVRYRDFPALEWTPYFKNTGRTATPIIADIQSLDASFERGAPGDFVLHHAKGSPAEASSFEPRTTVLGKKERDLRLATFGGRASNSTMPYWNLAWGGEGVVTAGDIQCPAEVEIVNPDLYLFTVDDAKTRLEIDLTVERGSGYSPANERAGHLPIGELPVDAIFSPVKRVNWSVASARVGQNTNYDKLTLEIWTDGTIAPEAALSVSSETLIYQLRFISGVKEEIMMMGVEKEVPGSRLTSEAAETPIENLDLSVRVFNSLKRTGITTVGDVLELLDKGEEAVMSIRNFGEKSLDELRQKMQEKGFLQDEKVVE